MKLQEMIDSRTPEEALAEATDALLASYALDAVGHDAPRLPSRASIVAVVKQVRRLLFPGYYAEELRAWASRRYYVGTWLCSVQADLAEVVVKAWRHGHAELTVENAKPLATALVRLFCAELPQIRGALRLDAEAAVEGDPAARNVEEVILTYPGFEAVMVHRIAHWLHEAGVPYIARAMSEYAHQKTGIDIHPGARIGSRFFIDHGTGVVIGETTDIGERVKIYQGVTLGALSVRRSLAGVKRHPTLEDGVVIYAGATVLGGDTVIGEGAIIGGNVWLTKSVEPRTVVLESPPTLDYRTRPER